MVHWSDQTNPVSGFESASNGDTIDWSQKFDQLLLVREEIGIISQMRTNPPVRQADKMTEVGIADDSKERGTALNFQLGDVRVKRSIFCRS